MIKPIFRTLIVALGIASLASCDYDYTDLDSSIIEDDIHYNMLRREGFVSAYDMPTGTSVTQNAVQTNNLPVNSLGVYDNPVFGKTVAHFVSQLQLATLNPTLTNPVIDSVYLYVPYYSTLESTDTDGTNTYSLDSIYGNASARIKLHVYENKYYLRSTQAGSNGQETQTYFSDEKSLVENNRGTVLLNDGIASQNEEFVFSASQVDRKYVEDGTTLTAESFAPGMFMYLNNDFFQEKILDPAAAGQGIMVNNNVFTEYFRGLYFQVEQFGDESVMAMPRFDQGKITIKFTDTELDDDGEPVVEDGVVQTEKRTITFNLTGNTINFFDNTYSNTFTNAIAANDPGTGDERLYIKGGAGAMAVIDILDDADIAALREERMLINEANLTFYIDRDQMNMDNGNGRAKEPARIYLYDLTNKRPLYDYSVDNTSNSLYPKRNKYVYGGLINYNSDETGRLYKFRITNHINNIINKDSTNVKLALVVTENINNYANAAIKNYVTVGSTEVKTVPVSAAQHPFGTVLYGSNGNVPDEKRLKLEIYYTKPN